MKRSKVILFVVLILTMLLVACGQEDEGSTSSPETITYEGTIVAMGNSLTEGLGVDDAETYPAQLAQKLAEDGYNFQVINAGVSGETSSGALSRLEWVLNLKPDIVILETGGNDGLRAIDPTLTKQNIMDIVTKLQDREILVILAGMQMTENLGESYIAEFEAIYPSVAQAQSIIFMPFFLEGVAADPTLNLPDAIHPNAAGYKIIVEKLYPFVLEAIDQFRGEP